MDRKRMAAELARIARELVAGAPYVVTREKDIWDLSLYGRLEELAKIRLHGFDHGYIPRWADHVQFDNDAGWKVEIYVYSDGKDVEWHVYPPFRRYAPTQRGTKTTTDGQATYVWDMGSLSGKLVNEFEGTCRLEDAEREINSAIDGKLKAVAQTDASPIRSIDDLREKLVEEEQDYGSGEIKVYGGYSGDGIYDKMLKAGNEKSILEFLKRHGFVYSPSLIERDGKAFGSRQEKESAYINTCEGKNICIRFFDDGKSPEAVYAVYDPHR